MLFVPQMPLTCAARINDHHHNLKHYFLKQLDAKLEQPMQWWVPDSLGLCNLLPVRLSACCAPTYRVTADSY